MARHLRMKGSEFEMETRMPGGDQVVIDVHTRRADVTSRTELRPARDGARVAHADAFFLKRQFELPGVKVMQGKPSARRSMTTLAAHAVGLEIRRRCGRRVDLVIGGNMATQAALVLVRRFVTFAI